MAKILVVDEDTPPVREKKILIVDDEEGVRQVLREFFKKKGYKILEAKNGDEALQLVSSEKISAVLLDINMPGMDGLTTLEKMLRINPKVGVVMITGDQDDEKVNEAISLGAYGYALKPFDFLYLELVVMSKLIIAEGDKDVLQGKAG
ncbi:MAG: response regulator [Candidatus Omnitrophota bacterium]